MQNNYQLRYVPEFFDDVDNIKDRLNIPTVYGSKTTVKISGNPKDGFQAEVLGTHYFPAAFENEK